MTERAQKRTGIAATESPVRIIYGGEPGRVESVKQNPGKVFAVIGPFDSFSDKRELTDALEMLVRGYNKR